MNEVWQVLEHNIIVKGKILLLCMLRNPQPYEAKTKKDIHHALLCFDNVILSSIILHKDSLSMKRERVVSSSRYVTIDLPSCVFKHNVIGVDSAYLSREVCLLM